MSNDETKINDGGAAFPSSNTPDTGYYSEGMSLRDYFAAKAMPAFIALLPSMTINPDQIDAAHAVANGAYEFADAMLKVREVKP